mgnify:CR=1 FL=1
MYFSIKELFIYKTILINHLFTLICFSVIFIGIKGADLFFYIRPSLPSHFNPNINLLLFLILVFSISCSDDPEIADKTETADHSEISNDPEITLEQIKSQSVQQNKPILMEFMRSDCEYCAKAERALEQNPTLSALVESVIYHPVNVLIGEGPGLKEQYAIGTTYPVYV